MTKPLGCYTSFTPGSKQPASQLLEEIRDSFGGDYFEGLSIDQKLLCIERLAYSMRTERTEDMQGFSEVFQSNLCQIVVHLPNHDKQGLIEALINWIRTSPKQEEKL